ncbi:DUF2939 domain-containing protein [Burkholderia oklahomensis]|uniref:DUF2939 domain-containing protein n=1 Tax=Burkholderia oklahomensis TaxID=342113 RepID=UPI0026567C0B|nr:DUF2939 domain-containing protein [Burkholderia oklahomensis]MDN7672981.1 DUF2939 domain-containing protein [Burkholderia oklahomensis]
MNSAVRLQRRFLKPVSIVVALVVAAAVIVYAYASPYLALRQLKLAIDARDAQAISTYVDFPALRISLKQQLADELMRRIDAQKRDNPIAIIGALIGSALVGPLVDAYATPEGVAALMNGLPPRAQSGQRPPELSRPGDQAASQAAAVAPAAGASSGGPGHSVAASSDATPAASDTAAQAAPLPASGTPSAAASSPSGTSPRTSAAYRSFDEFIVTYRRDDGSARYAAIFRRSGILGWKLSAVDLHGE